ncbi:MAG: hypothetical protein AAGJ18_25415 [Bacteroidota bacterium]
MKVFVLITAVIELLAGVAMIFMPHLIPDFAEADALSNTLSRMYGAAAIGLGFFALQTWLHMPSQVLQKAFLQTFLVFHIGVAAAGYWGFSNDGFEDSSVAILHLVLALVTAYFYFGKRNTEVNNG